MTGFPKGPKIEKKFISIEIFKSCLKCSISKLPNSPQKIRVWWAARLKFSISLENFKILNFFNLWALRVLSGLRNANAKRRVF